MRKRKYRKRRKRDWGKLYMRKNKVDFWGKKTRKDGRKNKVYFGEGRGRRPYLRKNKVSFGEDRKRSQKKEMVYLEQFFRQHYL